MIVSIDLDKVIPKMIDLCVDIHGQGISQVDAVRIVELLEESSIERQEGKWIFNKWAYQEYYRCSCCKKDFPLPPAWTANDIKKYLKYCSICGAKMS